MVDSGDVLVSAEGLTKHYPLHSGALARLLTGGRRVVRADAEAPWWRRLSLSEGPSVKAVDDVDLTIRRGETFGLVGESGCGKTTLGRLLLRLVEPTTGTIRFDGQDVTRLPERALRPLRRRMQLVFQDPHASLNPAMTIGDAVAHPLRIHGLAGTREEARERAWRMLEEVGLSPVENFFDKRPADLSGGQKQRVVIARAVVTEPDFVVADEPVSMLDMSVRAKILELLVRLKEKYGLTLVFITHDLATAKYLCDRVAIMYLGEVVEESPARDLFADPRMPYTRALLDAIPRPDPRLARSGRVARGEVPDAVSPPAGCRFHPRCPVATGRCGFTGRDVQGLAEEFLTRADAATRGRFEAHAGTPTTWRAVGHDLVIPVTNADAARAELERVLATGGEGLRDALLAMDADADGLRLRFRAPEPIRMRAQGDRRVLCLLHADPVTAPGTP